MVDNTKIVLYPLKALCRKGWRPLGRQVDNPASFLQNTANALAGKKIRDLYNYGRGYLPCLPTQTNPFKFNVFIG